MSGKRTTYCSILTVVTLLTLPALLLAQTATTARIAGTVSDVTGAVVPGASVELINTGTKEIQTTTTDASGQYVLANVVPGDYELTVTAQGFRVARVTGIIVNVARAYTNNVTLEVGAVTEVVEVSSDVAFELNTTDASIGNVLTGNQIPRLPSFGRQAFELFTIQPGVMPGGEVTGARNDQSVITLDGIDVSNQSIGGLGTYIQLPAEAIGEFRVGVANSNSTFGRASGGQVSIVTRSGSTEYHGAAYWWHQNDNLNANTWTRNHTPDSSTGQPFTEKPEAKRNLFGFRAGGPVTPNNQQWFWHVEYEGLRLPRANEITRLLPSDTLRAGTLRFRDATGTVVSYNLATSALCGPSGNLPCDPRGIGISPTAAATWGLMPQGNDSTQGDGLNTTGLRGTVGNPRDNNNYGAKLNYNINNNWKADGRIQYFEQSSLSSAQVSLLDNKITTARDVPTRQNFITGGLRGQFTSNFLGDFRFGFNRNRSAVAPIRPSGAAAILAGAGVPGLDDGGAGSGFVAVDFGTVNEPIDIGTQVARAQNNDNKNYQYNAYFTALRGNHTVQFGTTLRNLHTLHLRDDKVVSGGLGALVTLTATAALPAELRPPDCSATVTTNCLESADVSTWNTLYQSALGIVANTNVFMVRDGDFNPLPFGTQLTSDTKLWANDFFVQDVWRVTPSLTFTYGLSWSYQLAPTEKLGRQTVLINADTGEEFTASGFIEAKRQAALAGMTFNPTIGYLPIDSANRSGVFDTDTDNFSPRVAVAWNPSFSGGVGGWLFGEGKTVIRGGYNLIYDKQNTVQSVIIPALGVGFAQTINVTGATCDFSGTPGANCNPAGNTAEGTFRVGVDGQIPIPTAPPQNIPVVPTDFSPIYPELLSFQVDPKIEVPYNHQITVTWQRELPWNLLFEVGYSGRFARKLTQSVEFNNAPYFHVDAASGQSFAEAFDAVATALRTGNPVSVQPWFENQLPAASCVGFTSCTAFIASARSSNFINGQVTDLFGSAFVGLNNTINILRFQNGLPAFNDFTADSLFMRTSNGVSNYNGLLVSLRKRLSQGLSFDFNYTFSRSLDQSGAVQNSAGLVPNSFDLNTEYGPSAFDRTHVVRSWFVYDLPFSASASWADSFVRGWYVTGVHTFQTGTPDCVGQSSRVWGGSSVLGNTICAIFPGNASDVETSVHSGVTGSGGIGTASDPANGGTGLNMFANPEAVFNRFREVLISQDGRTGRSNPWPFLNRWNLSLTLGKSTSIAERYKVTFEAQFFNILNHVNFANPSTSFTGSANRRNFGVINGEFVPTERDDNNGSRAIQLGLRFEF